MSKWKNLDQYKKVYRFVGKRATTYLIAGILAGILAFAADLTFAYVLQMFLVVMKIIPMTATHFPDWIPTTNQYLFLGFVTSILVLKGCAQWLNSYLGAATYEIQRDFQRFRLVEWSLRAHSVSSSEIVTLYNSGIEAVCTVLMNLQFMSVLLSTSILIWIFMFKVSALVTLSATGGLLLVGIFSRGFDKMVGEEGKKIVIVLQQVNGRLLNNIKNLLLLQIYGTQSNEKQIIRSKLSAALHGVLRYQRILNLRGVIPQIAGMVIICALSVAAARREWIAPVFMISYFYLFVRFVQNFSDMAKMMSAVSYNLPTTLNFAKWWADHSHDSPRNPIVETDQPKNKTTLLGPVGWKLENIFYSYPNSTQTLLKNFSFTIKPGSALVITGESGSGKSTLLSLLLGIHHPNKGSINLIDGENLLSIDQVRKNFLQQVGYVGSESFLIEGSVRDNLMYGLDQVPNDSQIQDALERAGCEFISQLSNGLLHKITDQGQGLSAGQKQRLSFARALLRNPKVLILDEATANLDMETEKKIIKTILKMKGSTTIVAVTHREALLSIADQIIHLPQQEIQS